MPRVVALLNYVAFLSGFSHVPTLLFEVEVEVHSNTKRKGKDDMGYEP
jgi:hypothetical protein